MKCEVDGFEEMQNSARDRFCLLFFFNTKGKKEPRQQVGVAYTFMYIEEDGMLFAFDWIEYYLIDCN